MFFVVCNSCSINSVGGNIGNALIFNDTLAAQVQIQLIDVSNIEYQLNNLIDDATDLNEFQFTVKSKLNSALAAKKIVVLANNSSAASFVLTIERISYVVKPKTETFIEDNKETLVNTKEYNFDIDAHVKSVATGKINNITVNINDATRAGKTVFGTIGEKGSVTREEMLSRGIERFVGKLVKDLNKMT